MCPGAATAWLPTFRDVLGTRTERRRQEEEARVVGGHIMVSRELKNSRDNVFCMGVFLIKKL
jgi:hypothetical protein